MSEKIVIVGFGWVGQANALALSQMGHSVFYYDILHPTRHYSDRYASAYERIAALSEVRAQDSERTSYVVCIGDKVAPDGEQDISDVAIALEGLRGVLGCVILRSTILPDRLAELPFHFYVPEFLHERTAVEDALAPSWVVIGRNCSNTLPPFLESWRKQARKEFIGAPDEAAFIKYLSNVWNATRVAFVNEFGSAVGLSAGSADLPKINRVVDFVLEREPHLRFGRAFGGRCLPKDMSAFAHWYSAAGHSMALLNGVRTANLHHGTLTEHFPLPEWFAE